MTEAQGTQLLEQIAMLISLTQRVSFMIEATAVACCLIWGALTWKLIRYAVNSRSIWCVFLVLFMAGTSQASVRWEWTRSEMGSMGYGEMFFQVETEGGSEIEEVTVAYAPWLGKVRSRFYNPNTEEEGVVDGVYEPLAQWIGDGEMDWTEGGGGEVPLADLESAQATMEVFMSGDAAELTGWWNYVHQNIQMGVPKWYEGLGNQYYNLGGFGGYPPYEPPTEPPEDSDVVAGGMSWLVGQLCGLLLAAVVCVFAVFLARWCTDALIARYVRGR